MGTEQTPTTTNPGKPSRKPYKRSPSTIYVLTPIQGDQPLRLIAGPFPTIKKAKAAITEAGAYDIVCLREQVEVSRRQ